MKRVNVLTLLLLLACCAASIPGSNGQGFLTKLFGMLGGEHPAKPVDPPQGHSVRLAAGWRQFDDGRCTYYGNVKPCPAAVASDSSDSTAPQTLLMAPKLVAVVPKQVALTQQQKQQQLMKEGEGKKSGQAVATAAVVSEEKDNEEDEKTSKSKPKAHKTHKHKKHRKVKVHKPTKPDDYDHKDKTHDDKSKDYKQSEHDKEDKSKDYKKSEHDKEDKSKDYQKGEKDHDNKSKDNKKSEKEEYENDKPRNYKQSEDRKYPPSEDENEYDAHLEFRRPEGMADQVKQEFERQAALEAKPDPSMVQLTDLVPEGDTRSRRNHEQRHDQLHRDNAAGEDRLHQADSHDDDKTMRRPEQPHSGPHDPRQGPRLWARSDRDDNMPRHASGRVQHRMPPHARHHGFDPYAEDDRRSSVRDVRKPEHRSDPELVNKRADFAPTDTPAELDPVGNSAGSQPAEEPATDKPAPSADTSPSVGGAVSEDPVIKAEDPTKTHQAFEEPGELDAESIILKFLQPTILPEPMQTKAADPVPQGEQPKAEEQKQAPTTEQQQQPASDSTKPLEPAAPKVEEPKPDTPQPAADAAQPLEPMPKADEPQPAPKVEEPQADATKPAADGAQPSEPAPQVGKLEPVPTLDDPGTDAKPLEPTLKVEEPKPAPEAEEQPSKLVQPQEPNSDLTKQIPTQPLEPASDATLAPEASEPATKSEEPEPTPTTEVPNALASVKPLEIVAKLIELTPASGLEDPKAEVPQGGGAQQQDDQSGDTEQQLAEDKPVEQSAEAEEPKPALKPERTRAAVFKAAPF